MSNEKSLTAEYVRSILSYCPETGSFTWLVNRHRKQPGQQAGSIDSGGYIRITIDGQRYMGHRLAWLLVHGEWPSNCIDHVNRDRSDNRFTNLRAATNAENCQNHLREPGASGLRGVKWHSQRRKWQAAIRVNGLRKHLGLFQTADEASAAYQAARKSLHPFAPELLP